MQTQFASVDKWVQISGLGRTTVYKLIGTGKLRAVKAGRRTLIDVAAGLEYLNDLPAAEITTGRIGGAA